MKTAIRICLPPGILLFFLASIPASDPSLVPVIDPRDEKGYVERWRLQVDLDDDGDEDLLLSEPTVLFGTMGGTWTVYLNDKTTYREIGILSAHPRVISLEPDKERFLKEPSRRFYVRAWVYLKSSGSEGAFGYYRIGFDSVSDFQGVDLYPGDGGTDLGRAVYEAAFSDSPVPYRLQFSETNPEGEVTWKVAE